MTRGEKLLMTRRRLGWTQSEAARRHSVSLYTYRRWEGDTDGTSAPTTKVGKLAMFEQCFLLRKREGMTLIEAAEVIGVCRWWLCQMESGEAPIDRLREYWAA